MGLNSGRPWHLKIELCLGIDVSFGRLRPGSMTVLERRPDDGHGLRAG